MLGESELNEYLNSVIAVEVIREEETPLNYSVKFIEWKSKKLEFEIDFEDPLLVSESVELDQLEIKIR